MGGQGQPGLLAPSGHRHSSLPSEESVSSLLTEIRAQEGLALE